eukprot:TRINITY_DN6510_c6_g1_i1.p2 TRINITY_DN6510_c6_g1~~TRINITY_DN6510_c6_g1_i1.p2  ORF type:complete len:292 (+),score=108.89 TRINITY_DN6510_c6_g1_i1:67-942(+)
MMRVVSIAALLCAAAQSSAGADIEKEREKALLSVATFGMGCFWQAKAKFLKVPGVQHVRMGYMGGTVESPTQDMLAVRDDTGHSEVIQLFYNPKEIRYERLLEIFWKSHQPWHEGRQGLNVGRHFGSVVFYHNKPQFRMARDSLKKMREHPLPSWRRRGKAQVPNTELHSAKTFWPAHKGPGGAWPQYHCHGERPRFAESVRNFTSAHDERMAKQKEAMKHPALPAGWEREVRRTRMLLRENRLRRWREGRHDEDERQGLRSDKPRSKESSKHDKPRGKEDSKHDSVAKKS